MKKLILLLFSISIYLQGFSQFSNESFAHNGINRMYRIYVPPVYDHTKEVPLLLCLHGLGDNMNNFSLIGMNYLADTANFIVVYPQAVYDPVIGATSWNSGAGYNSYYPNANINDVDFLKTLIDTIAAHYKIDQKRVYSSGFSMGGFMTNRLACEAGDRIAAIASVAGTMGNGFACVPSKAIPVCHFHGTSDATVTYNDGQYGKGAQSLINFWTSNNACYQTPVHTALPNTANDGYTVDHYRYSPCDSGTVVELFKINGAGHNWLTPLNDISYSIEIWKFLSKHHFQTVFIDDAESKNINNGIEINPNPSNGIFNVRSKNKSKFDTLKVINLLGEIVFSDHIQTENFNIDLSAFPSGVYVVKLEGNQISAEQKIILKK